MNTETKKKKIAILGGGTSAVTTAIMLSEEGWQDHFESITIYQMGWRMGGKGATGRGKNGSIEEHGLHIWLGYYENAFQLIQEIYKWARRPAGSPMATWEKAFTAHNYVGVNQQFKNEWKPWMFDFPPNSGTPGEGGKMPTLFEYIEMILGWIARLHRPRGIFGWFRWLFNEARLLIGVLGDDSVHALSKGLGNHAGKVHQAEHHNMLIALLKKVTKKLEKELLDEANHSLEARQLLLLMNMGATISLGLLLDGVFSTDDLEKLEDTDFSEWLKKHNALPLISDLKTNPLLRGMYDFAFAYEDGDVSKPNFATAPVLRTVFRMLLTYKGSVFWKMNAGMGDTIFAPAYEALINRGVTVEFFHKVTNLGLADDNSSVATIEFDVQATTKSGKAYQPLFDLPVKEGSLPCWPRHPLYEQLNEGQKMEDEHVNLESLWTEWKGKPKTLNAGEDFDVAVFGISLASVPYLCDELLQESKAWREMVKEVATVRTQACQLWLNRDIKSLGWEEKSPVIDAWIPPLNTWADMTLLLKDESWPGDGPKSLAYFCGPMEGGIPNPKNPDVPKLELAKVEQVVDKMLSGHINTLWTNLDSSGLPKSDIMLKYCRANIDPSERYVMSVAGSAKHRLRANQSGFSNLVLTGDWIQNGYNAGCIEASAWSGIQAANVILGRSLNEGVIT
jgi:uncharacterized protein with NAD-binding domain and iron-sulfur cluster